MAPNAGPWRGRMFWCERFALIYQVFLLSYFCAARTEPGIVPPPSFLFPYLCLQKSL